MVLLVLFCSATSVIAFLSLVSIVYQHAPETGAPTGIQAQSPEALSPSLTRVQVEQGEKLFGYIRARSPAVLQVSSRDLRKGATAALIIPRPLWNSLSKPDQISLTFFAESPTSGIWAEPATFAGVPATAPTYAQVVNNVANLCDSCWAILVGEVTSTDRIVIEETLVQGDGAWARDEFKSGVKASQFRAK